MVTEQTQQQLVLVTKIFDIVISDTLGSVTLGIKSKEKFSIIFLRSNCKIIPIITCNLTNVDIFTL